MSDSIIQVNLLKLNSSEISSITYNISIIILYEWYSV